MRTLVTLLLCVFAAVATARPVVIPWVDDHTHLTTVTEDWPHAYAHMLGLYGVTYTATVTAADTLELFCDIGGVPHYLPMARIMFVDTDGSAAPAPLLISTGATRTSGGTGLTEYRLNQAAAAPATAWWLNSTGADGTVIASYLIRSGEWFHLPEWLAFTGDYHLGLVLADTAYVSFEAVWTEE